MPLQKVQPAVQEWSNSTDVTFRNAPRIDLEYHVTFWKGWTTLRRRQSHSLSTDCGAIEIWDIFWRWANSLIPPQNSTPPRVPYPIHGNTPTYIYIGDNPLAEWSESDPIISIIGVVYKLLIVGNVGLLVGSVLLSSTNSPVYWAYRLAAGAVVREYFLRYANKKYRGSPNMCLSAPKVQIGYGLNLLVWFAAPITYAKWYLDGCKTIICTYLYRALHKDDPNRSLEYLKAYRVARKPKY